MNPRVPRRVDLLHSPVVMRRRHRTRRKKHPVIARWVGKWLPWVLDGPPGPISVAGGRGSAECPCAPEQRPSLRQWQAERRCLGVEVAGIGRVVRQPSSRVRCARWRVGPLLAARSRWAGRVRGAASGEARVQHHRPRALRVWSRGGCGGCPWRPRTE